MKSYPGSSSFHVGSIKPSLSCLNHLIFSHVRYVFPSFDGSKTEVGRKPWRSCCVGNPTDFTDERCWKCGRTRWERAGMFDDFWGQQNTVIPLGINVGMWDWIVLYHVIQCNGGFTECHKPVDSIRLLYILYYLGMIGIHKHADDMLMTGAGLDSASSGWDVGTLPCVWCGREHPSQLIRLYKDIQLSVYNLIIQYIIY